MSQTTEHGSTGTNVDNTVGLEFLLISIFQTLQKYQKEKRKKEKVFVVKQNA